jgi:hypothetical protein
MSETLINQITLDCLLNKKMYNNQIMHKKSKQINHEERKFYRKRIYNLFKDMITGKQPDDLLLDVKYAYDNYINATINYFKTIDSTDIIQAEHNGDNIMETDEQTDEHVIETQKEDSNNPLSHVEEADAILMRSVKIEVPTLDKYVKRTKTKPLKEQPQFIIPKQKEINLNDPQLKNKGIKNNITNIYEDKNAKKENEEK